MDAEFQKALQFFDSAREKLNGAPGPGFFTAAQYASERNLHTANMKKLLDKMVAAGMAETAIGRSGPHNNIITTYYRIFPH